MKGRTVLLLLVVGVGLTGCAGHLTDMVMQAPPAGQPDMVDSALGMAEGVAGGIPVVGGFAGMAIAWFRAQRRGNRYKEEAKGVQPRQSSGGVIVNVYRDAVQKKETINE